MTRRQGSAFLVAGFVVLVVLLVWVAGMIGWPGLLWRLALAALVMGALDGIGWYRRRRAQR